MLRKSLSILVAFHVFISCGFTPTLKMLDQNQVGAKIYFEIKNSTYLARETLRTFLKSTNKNEAQYIIDIKVNEAESAVNIASNGSVLEYKIEVLIEYQIIDNNNESLIHKSQSRGFANYDVSNSEYSTNLIKNEALKTAILEAAQLMSIMVESKINR